MTSSGTQPGYRPLESGLKRPRWHLGGLGSFAGKREFLCGSEFSRRGRLRRASLSRRPKGRDAADCLEGPANLSSACVEDRYAIVDGLNGGDSRVHYYPPLWNAAPRPGPIPHEAPPQGGADHADLRREVAK